MSETKDNVVVCIDHGALAEMGQHGIISPEKPLASEESLVNANYAKLLNTVGKDVVVHNSKQVSAQEAECMVHDTHALVSQLESITHGKDHVLDMTIIDADFLVFLHTSGVDGLISRDHLASHENKKKNHVANRMPHGIQVEEARPTGVVKGVNHVVDEGCEAARNGVHKRVGQFDEVIAVALVEHELTAVKTEGLFEVVVGDAEVRPRPAKRWHKLGKSTVKFVNSERKWVHVQRGRKKKVIGGSDEVGPRRARCMP
ncbi:hypothetical protein VNO78_07882 [Psophocarpus tetragonolobus]|uniref:Uncharacterized protein n=1 Tax=Psophocarpus tetragonolobus TaxID=3891 RepID=A0AAN9SWY7_PSOTE